MVCFRRRAQVSALLPIYSPPAYQGESVLPGGAVLPEERPRVTPPPPSVLTVTRKLCDCEMATLRLSLLVLLLQLANINATSKTISIKPPTAVFFISPPSFTVPVLVYRAALRDYYTCMYHHSPATGHVMCHVDLCCPARSCRLRRGRGGTGCA